MKQTAYPMIVLGYAGKTQVTAQDKAPFSKAVAAIRKHSQHGVVLVSIGRNDLPLQTAIELVRLMGLKLQPLQWGRSGTLRAFGQRVEHACKHKELLVLVTHRPIIDWLLERAGLDTSSKASVASYLEPHRLRLVITKRKFHEPDYEVRRMA